MAIIKFIEIHDSSGISNCLDYVNDPNKNVLHKEPSAPAQDSRTAADQVENVIDYSVNPEKTLLKSVDGNLSLVSGVNCSADFAAESFGIARTKYYDVNNGMKSINNATNKKGDKKEKHPIEAIHVIQSFPELEGDQNDPELVHHLGVLFAQRMFPNHMCVVSTHMNTKHLHNHIVVCAYETDRPKKFKNDLKAYRKMREINDELSLEYGLPVLGMDRDPDLEESIDNELRYFGSGKITTIGMSNGEKEARRENKSWKQILENTIDSLAASSGSWDDFVRSMSQAGYGIRETKTNITYYELSNAKHRVRGTTLANKTDYTKDNLILQYGWKETTQGKTAEVEASYEDNIYEPYPEEMPDEPADGSTVPDYDVMIGKPKDIIPDSLTGNTPKPEHALVYAMPAYEVPKNKPKPIKFHISRYTKFGRRRSDLELIFLAAIRIIAYIKDWFADLAHPEKNPKNIPYIKKIETLQRAMHNAKAYTINSVENLQLALKETGIELSNQKAVRNDLEKNKSYLEDMVKTLDRLDTLRSLHPEIGVVYETPEDMNIRVPGEKEVQKNRASLQPLTPKLRRSLFSLLKEYPELSLKFGWNEMSERLSLSQGRILNEYLKSLSDNPSAPIPKSLTGVLETSDDHRKNSKAYFYENLRIKKDKSIQEKYKDLPLNMDMFKKLKSLCDEKGLTIDLNSLSMYEGMQVLGYYAKNDYDKPLIDKGQKKILQKALKDSSLTLSRKIDYVTKDEYEAILRHLKNPRNYRPEILNASPPIRPSEAKQIEELLKVKNEKTSIPVRELSQEDGDRLFDYLLNKGSTPDIVVKIEKANGDSLFNDKIASLPEEQRSTILEYRSLLDKITDLGVSPSDRRVLTAQLEQISGALKTSQAKVNELSSKYKSLNNIGKCLVYANDLSFTHGVNFERQHDKRCEVEFINERSETDRSIFNKEIEQEEIIEEQVKGLSSLPPGDWNGIPGALLDMERIRQENMSYLSLGVAEANERQKIARLNKEAVKKQEHEKEQQPEQEHRSPQRKKASPDLGH